MDLKRLNLGCGAFKKPGFLNVDVNNAVDPDMVVDMSRFPYPFTDEEFDHIEADHSLEHTNDPFATMREIHRVLKKGGTLVIRVPHFSRAMAHPDHKRGFDVSFSYYFQSSFPGGFMGFEFELQSLRLTWNGQRHLKKAVLPSAVHYGLIAIGTVIDVAANLSPALCSRVWCYWVGGFDELEFRFVKPLG